jgi:hypothetical protein
LLKSLFLSLYPDLWRQVMLGKTWRPAIWKKNIDCLKEIHEFSCKKEPWSSGWWLTYPCEKWWTSSMGRMTSQPYDENNPAMFETTVPSHNQSFTPWRNNPSSFELVPSFTKITTVFHQQKMLRWRLLETHVDCWQKMLSKLYWNMLKLAFTTR